MKTHTIWNHRVHQEWAGEELTFWRLAFFPTYDYDKISPILREVMKDLGVSSYVVYETLGVFDIFIRAWLPAKASDRFEQSLTAALAGESLQLCEAFAVTEVIRHWVWDDDQDHDREPSREVLAKPLNTETIERTNYGKLTADEWSDLEAMSVVRRQSLVVQDGAGGIENVKAQKGVKFLIVIASSVYMTTYRERERVAKQLLRILRDHKVREASLYEGNGFGQFVMMGRVLASEFYVLPRLAIAVDSASRRDTARPYTFLSARPGLMQFEERLPEKLDTELVDAANVSELLRRVEDRQFVTADSAWMNWRRYLIGEDARLTADERLFNNRVVASIVGLLNADGGYLVVGALNAKARFGPTSAAEHQLLSEFDRVGDYICVGIDAEMDEYDWGEFRLKLQSTIRLRIEPTPVGSMRIGKQRVGKRDLCMINVLPTTATWYYRRVDAADAPTFFAREDGRTVVYGGLQADAYKRSSPRG